MRAIRENRVIGADGVPIWYRAIGEGPAIVCCNGVGVSTFFWHYLAEYYGDTHKVVVWDYRGHGESGLPNDFDNWTMEKNITDLTAVMDDADIERAVLVGHSMGCQVVLEAWRHIPERIAALIPMLGAAGHPVKTFFNTELSEYVFKFGYYFGMNHTGITQRVKHFISGLNLSYHVARLIVIDPQFASKEDFKPYFEHFGRIDPRAFFAMAAAMAEHSAVDLLPEINVPVLVVGGEQDVFTPYFLTEQMLRSIPGAELLQIKRGSHAALIEQPQLINLRLEKFFRERLPEWDRKVGS
ncbi:MAG TPA: alpha/beta hydrolase [bacterium]|nr:alpha/beta hydrolase [bacterium]